MLRKSKKYSCKMLEVMDIEPVKQLVEETPKGYLTNSMLTLHRKDLLHDKKVASMQDKIAN